jgi:hypothetical protein
MRRDFVLLAVLFLGCSGVLLAQEEKTGYEIGGFASWQKWRGRTFQIGPPQTSTPVPLGFGYSDRAAYGVRGNFLSQGRWAGELSYSYQKNKVTLTRQSFTSVALPGAVHQFFYNQIFYPARYGRAVVPFVTGGVGLAAYHLSDETLARAADPLGYGLGNLNSNDVRAALNYGGGVKVNVAPQFGLRFDFRHMFSDVPSYGVPKQSANPAQITLPIGGKLQTFDFSAGIYFRFLSEGYR